MMPVQRYPGLERWPDSLANFRPSNSEIFDKITRKSNKRNVVKTRAWLGWTKRPLWVPHLGDQAPNTRSAPHGFPFTNLVKIRGIFSTIQFSVHCAHIMSIYNQPITETTEFVIFFWSLRILCEEIETMMILQLFHLCYWVTLVF